MTDHDSIDARTRRFMLALAERLNSKRPHLGAWRLFDLGEIKCLPYGGSRDIPCARIWPEWATMHTVRLATSFDFRAIVEGLHNCSFNNGPHEDGSWDFDRLLPDVPSPIAYLSHGKLPASVQWPNFSASWRPL